MARRGNSVDSKARIFLESIIVRKRELKNCPGWQAGGPLWPLIFFAFFSGTLSGLAQESGAVLTNAVDIISLPAAEAARSLKVSVTGVVTAADPVLKGRFFLQDSTGGIFVDNVNGRRPEPGTVVEVIGISHPGAYAPIITAPQVRPIGAAPLPPAKPVTIERLMSGAEDSQRIEITGVVRDARIEGLRLAVDVVSGGYRFRVFTPVPPGADPQKLIAARVRVRGTAAEAHNRSLRQLIVVEIYVPAVADFIVEESEPVNPFSQPIVPLDSLAQYRRDNSLDHRARVRGVVTLQRPGETLFLQDATGGLQVQSQALDVFSPGEVIEAAGFPSFDQYLPVLQDAVFRKTQEPRATVAPKNVSIEDLQNGLHHADFISWRGVLINRTSKQELPQPSGPPRTRTTLVLQNSNVTFTAEAGEPQAQAELASIPIGSTVEARGICLMEIDSAGKMKSFRILLGGPEAVRVLARPSWLTPRSLLISLGIVSSVLLAIVAWTVMVSRKNATLSFLVREREKAQIELQQAHDLLEQRVKERTEELKFQTTARREAELQFKAVLGERTRLAQELHDTVEQTLTGIALQLDTAAKLYESKPGDALNHLDLARNLMAKSQVEMRRSVWDLRRRALEQFDLSGALQESARQLTHGTGIEVELETTGPVRALPEVVELNLLRIGQEALTNVIKHAKASRVNIELAFGPQQVVLQIKDNGTGFTPDKCLGPDDGHFGLQGMSERAKRVGGRFLPGSAPGRGTTLRVEVPLGPTEEFQWPAHVAVQRNRGPSLTTPEA
jgi:signal transduction histidine kinase